MRKKLVSILVVLVMALSLPVMVLAEDGYNGSTDSDGDYGSTGPWMPPPPPPGFPDGWVQDPPPQPGDELGCEFGHHGCAWSFWPDAPPTAYADDDTPLNVDWNMEWNNYDESGMWIPPTQEEEQRWQNAMDAFWTLRGDIQGNIETCDWHIDETGTWWRLPGGDMADPFITAFIEIGTMSVFLPDGEQHTGSGWVSFSSEFLNGSEVVRILQYVEGNGWSIIGEAQFVDGEWRFPVDNFGFWSLFIALVERGVAPEEAARTAAQVLGAVSPDTSDNSLGMFAMIAIMLSALGIAAFAITRAKKEMAK